jgi:hypothetical protein
MKTVNPTLLLIAGIILLTACKNKPESASSELPKDSVKVAVPETKFSFEEAKLDSSFVMDHLWLKLERDEEGYFYLPLDPCDDTNKSFSTVWYHVNIVDTTLVDGELTIPSRHKIVNVKCNNKDNLDFKLEIKTDGPNTFPFSVIVEPIDDLHPERKICRFLQVIQSTQRVDTLGLFIAEVLNDKVNHKRVQECTPH